MDDMDEADPTFLAITRQRNFAELIDRLGLRALRRQPSRVAPSPQRLRLAPLKRLRVTLDRKSLRYH